MNIITPKNIKKEIEINIQQKKKIEKKYYQLYKNRKVKKQKLFSNLVKNKNNDKHNNHKENLNNNAIIQKHNTSINMNNKNSLNKKYLKNSINIIDILRNKGGEFSLYGYKYIQTKNDGVIVPLIYDVNGNKFVVYF